MKRCTVGKRCPELFQKDLAKYKSRTAVSAELADEKGPKGKRKSKKAEKKALGKDFLGKK